MGKKILRTVRRDLTMLTSLALVGLVGLALLTGLGMDDAAEEILPLDDVHEAVGYLMALVAGLHVLLRVSSLWTWAKKRGRDLFGGTPARTSVEERRLAVGGLAVHRHFEHDLGEAGARAQQHALAELEHDREAHAEAGRR